MVDPVVGSFSARVCARLFLSALICANAGLLAAQTSPADEAVASVTVPQTQPVGAMAPVASVPPEMKGDLLMARGRYVAALEAYREGPLTSAPLWNKMGIAYHHLFALDEAEKAYRRALIIDPHYAAALNNLAAVYEGRHDYKQAERTYKLALKYKPNVAVTYGNLGTAYFADLNYKKGMKAYETALKLDPNVFNLDESRRVTETSSRQQLMVSNYYVAKTLASAGKQEEAVAYLRKAIGEGFHDRKRLETDKGFDPIRGSPEFQKILSQQRSD
ncbi:MAG TPA: tetratricopeptide repeat protein [Acidobacteriaceae bacterium]|nr:tetratricopeptide repeat protein [Acidobacteriaceae bacterium]